MEVRSESDLRHFLSTQNMDELNRGWPDCESGTSSSRGRWGARRRFDRERGPKPVCVPAIVAHGELNP